MIFYRYEDVVYYGGYGAESVKILEKEFTVVKETPCGYWVTPMIIFYHPDGKIDYKLCKWVSKTSRKRFAYPTKEEAWESFKYRKNRQKQLLTKQLERVNNVLELIEKKPKP
jgi:hypothetical protein